jgi:uroporphyrinogen-III synthase
MRLIVTRPEPDAGRTAELLSRLGHVPILSPMLDIEPDRAAALPEGPVQAVLVTSSNAVRALGEHPGRERLRDLPLLAVGDRTALEARRAGFSGARSAGGAIDDLVRLACENFDPAGAPLLHAAGDVLAGDLAGRLAEHGFNVETVTLYRARARTELSPAAAAALRSRSVDGVLLYSRRSAAAFALALRAGGLAPLAPEVACFCLSAATAEPLAAVTSGRVLVAERPDQINLIALIERLGEGEPAGRGRA